MKSELRDHIKKLSLKYFDETKAYRHQLHQYPELSFQEFQTADFIEKKLYEIGFTEVNRIGKTGVVAMLHTHQQKKKTIGLRADLDALPITEATDVSYQSKIKGVMHACGHDVHTASLLTAAKILFQIKDQLEGNVKFIFQPGEELLPGGASVLIKEGVLEQPEVDILIAQHVTPQIDSGKVGFKKGLFMASTDEIYLIVQGKGGHAAMPHTYNNPLLIAAAILTALNRFFMIEKNENDKDIPTVLAFGKIEGLGATNVIPNEVKIAGTFRSLDETWRKRAHEIITNLCHNMAQSMGGSCEVDIHYGYPCLVNDEMVTELCRQEAGLFLGEENIQDISYRMTAEDFAYYSQLKPVCFYRLGTGNSKKNTHYNVHHSSFNIDEDVLQFAPGLMAAMAIRLMG